MIGTSTPEYIFIRACIGLLRLVIPIFAFCCVLVSGLWPQKYRIPVIVQIWAVAEVLFYLLVFLPRYFYLQRAAIHPPLVPRQKRRQLFDLCMRSARTPDRYLTKWFMDAPLSEIKRENLKEFFAWAFLNKGAHGLLDDEELEEYIDEFEASLGRKLDPGRGAAIPLRLTIDEVKMMHRPLLWYFVSSMMDMIDCVFCDYIG